jgi:hypothetical protein
VIIIIITSNRDWKTITIDCTVPVSEGAEGMVERMISICEEAAEAVQGSYGQKGIYIYICLYMNSYIYI